MVKEKTDSYLRMSVLNAISTLKEYQLTFPDKSTDEIIEIIRGVGTYKSTYDYNGAKQFLKQVNLADVLNLRDMITVMLREETPSWMYQIQFGREIVASCLVDNDEHDILQCLESAGLYSTEPDVSVIQWWDQLAALMRSNENESKVRSGRTGELLTLEYEKEKLKGSNVKPKWISIENNLAGYDVLSFEENPMGIRQKMIEVKACQSRPIAFFLSKNEWKSAKDYGDSYVFHIWYLPQQRLLELKVEDVERNIPINQGSGEWQTVLINVDDVYQQYQVS